MYYIPSTYDWLTLKNAYENSVYSTSTLQFASDLLLPFAGFRNYGKGVYSQSNNGAYWSSSPSIYATHAYAFFFNLSSFISQDYSSHSRSDGLSVRCVRFSPNTSTFTLHANGGTKAVVAFTGTVGNGKFTTL